MSCQTPIVENLRNHGVRITPQREIILETLCHSSRHLTAEEVFTQVESRLPGLNIATVYRTLEMLRRVRVVSMIPGTVGRQEFEVLHSEKNHHHLVCENCGAILEIDPELLNGLHQAIEEQYEFSANLEHLSFSGLCSHCRSAE